MSKNETCLGIQVNRRKLNKNDVLLVDGLNRWRKLELNRLTRIKKMMAKNRQNDGKDRQGGKLTVFEKDGKLYADSRDVAEMKGKRHADLCRDIAKYIAVLTECNFALSDFFVESSYKGDAINYLLF